MRPLTQLLLALALCGGGAAFTHWVGWPVYRTARDSESWPVADGRIVSSRVESQYDVKKNTTVYSAKVDFDYEVKGQNYRSSWISPNGSSSSTAAQSQRNIIDRYPVDKEVKVSYDPANPKFGVLEPGATGMTYFVLGAGPAIILAGIVLAGIALTRGRGNPQEPPRGPSPGDVFS